jgi:uncharacterized membrane protein YozB (DUF420 family)
MGSLFGTTAPLLSDGVAVFEIAVAVLLLVGTFVVRRGWVRLHARIQASMVLLNVPVVLVWMVPRYLSVVFPGLPSEIVDPFYWVPTLMLVVGAIAEGLGVYIVLVAGTNLLPERFRFRSYKRWMRADLVLGWGVVVLGLGTYFVWYVHA